MLQAAFCLLLSENNRLHSIQQICVSNVHADLTGEVSLSHLQLSKHKIPGLCPRQSLQYVYAKVTYQNDCMTAELLQHDSRPAKLTLLSQGVISCIASAHTCRRCSNACNFFCCSRFALCSFRRVTYAKRVLTSCARKHLAAGMSQSQ